MGSMGLRFKSKKSSYILILKIFFMAKKKRNKRKAKRTKSKIKKRSILTGELFKKFHKI